MDFSGRGSQPTQPANPASQVSSSAPAGNNKKSNKDAKASRLTLIASSVAALVLVVLFAAVVVSVATKKTEADRVDSTKLQAVFLQTGQVYFGKIDNTSFAKDSFVLNDIYYLQTSSASGTTAQQTANTNVSLVKLGCELHAPRDQMVINREQVTFWENLNQEGQVAKAVATFQKDNPNGQKCADQGAAPNTTTNVQGSGTGTGTTNTTTGNGSSTTTNP